MKRTGDITSSYELAREYAFTDYDGRQPHLDDHMAQEVVRSLTWMREGIERHVAWLERLAARGRRYLGRGMTTVS
ncbi:MAG: hypothetical protein HYT81_05000 [Gemmatimonadetes bacterium]|nr:hypothetical protein [Gemmatimonadota bacterium]